MRRHRYRFTSHALDEMADEEITSLDVVQSLLSGRVVRIERAGRGRRVYTVEGRSAPGRRIRVVCRFDNVSGRLVVITVYEMFEAEP